MSSSATAPAVLLPGPLATMGNIFLAPAAAARGIPRPCSWPWPLAIAATVTGAASTLLIPATLRVMQLDPPRGMSAEQLERSLGTIEMFARIGAVMAPVTMAAVLSALAGVLFVTCSMTGIPASYRNLFSLLAHCSLISILQLIAGFVVVRLKGDDIQTLEQLRPSFGVGLFLGEDTGRVLRAVLDYFSVFTLWYIGALVAGLAALTGTSRAKAFLVSIPVWLLPLLVTAGGAVFRR